MGLVLFLKGVLVGFFAAMPIGPVNVLCIQRTLGRGRGIGLVSGLGAATVDALYGGAAGLGLTVISGTLARNEELFHIIGGLIVLAFGARLIQARPGISRSEDRVSGYAGAYFSTLLLTFANPTTIFSYGLLFAGLGPVHAFSRVENSILIVPGVFIGSTLWWVVLTRISGLFRRSMNERGMVRVNRIAGMTVVAFGLFMLLRH